MEMKDIIALIFTLVMIVLFQIIGRPKKKGAPMRKKEAEKPPQKPKLTPQPRRTPPSPILSKRSSHIDHYSLQKPLKKKMNLFEDKSSIKKAFIMQEVLKRPLD